MAWLSLMAAVERINLPRLLVASFFITGLAFFGTAIVTEYLRRRDERERRKRR